MIIIFNVPKLKLKEKIATMPFISAAVRFL